MQKSLVLFADACTETGYGHLFRSVLVAQTLLKDGYVKVRAVMAEGHDAALLERYGIPYEFHPGPIVDRIQGTTVPDYDLVLIDTYEICEVDISALCKQGFVIGMFDDGRRFAHYDAALVVDSAPSAVGLNYCGRKDTEFLLGLRYFPLRQEFRNFTRKVQKPKADKVVVTMGGSDPDDITYIAVRALRNAFNVIAILGPGYVGQITEKMSDARLTVHRNVKDMASIFAEVDMIVCGAGATALEASAMGLPSLMVILSEDQHSIGKSIEEFGAGKLLGISENINAVSILEKTQALALDQAARSSMSEMGCKLIDGNGADLIGKKVRELL